VAGYSGDAGDALAAAPNSNWNANGKAFSTPDSDNDEYPGGSCAADKSCGWWFAYCSTSAINEDNYGYGIWTTDYPPDRDVYFSRMLVKLN